MEMEKGILSWALMAKETYVDDAAYQKMMEQYIDLNKRIDVEWVDFLSKYMRNRHRKIISLLFCCNWFEQIKNL